MKIKITYIFYRIVVVLMIGFNILNLQSCIVYNSTKFDKEKVCKLHNQKMRKTIVRTIYGINDPYDAMTAIDKFPHAKTRIGMGRNQPFWPIKRLALTYYCDKCDSIKNEYYKRK